LAVQWLQCDVSEVDAALWAVSQGVYGVWVECGEPITLKRLETIPWASHCIGCQESLERREGWNRVPLLERCALVGTGRPRDQATHRRNTLEQHFRPEDADMPARENAARSTLGRGAVLVDTFWKSTILNSVVLRRNRRRDGRRNL
jgi:hypothetical protein